MPFLLDAGRSPATINRALISIALWLDFTGSADNNPARKVNHIEVVQTAPQALTRQQWNAVRREAERLTSKDHGLGLALVSLLRYAGSRVGETAALLLSDVQL